MAQEIHLKDLASLTQRIGVPKSTVYQWQRGRGRPPWRLMPQIADALAVPLPQLAEVLWMEKAEIPAPVVVLVQRFFRSGDSRYLGFLTRRIL
jgi:transcriptional regulator with XRE-family HTH domain